MVPLDWFQEVAEGDASPLHLLGVAVILIIGGVASLAVGGGTTTVLNARPASDRSVLSCACDACARANMKMAAQTENSRMQTATILRAPPSRNCSLCTSARNTALFFH